MSDSRAARPTLPFLSAAMTVDSELAEQLVESFLSERPMTRISSTGHDLTLAREELTIEVFPGMTLSVADAHDTKKMKEAFESCKKFAADENLSEEERTEVGSGIARQLSKYDTLVHETGNYHKERCENLMDLQDQVQDFFSAVMP